ncbi:MAG: VanZ family protein [bacterium]|nr:VanZ family protein [bacterium]
MKKNIDWIALLAWCGVIFFFSSVPNLSSGLKEDFLLRKIAHASEYAVLAFLFFNVLRNRFGDKHFNILMTALVALAYAFTDEVHQTFVRGRSGNFFDISIDSLGITIGLLLIMFFGYCSKRKKQ